MLKCAEPDQQRREAEILLLDTMSRAMSIDRTVLYRDDPELTSELEKLFFERIRRRATGEPIQYILGEVEFLGLRIKVGPGVLIPRPESECWLDDLISWWQRNRSGSPRKILDLCTGSGCLALALAQRFSDSEVTGVDISADALRFARDNAALNRIDNVTFVFGDLFSALRLDCQGPDCDGFDILVSNPPYVSASEFESLDPEVSSWEPSKALIGGDDGLDFYRRIIPDAHRFLASGALLAFEIGAGQGSAVCGLMNDSGFIENIGIAGNNENIKKNKKIVTRIYKDYAGLDRAIFGVKK